MMKKISLLDEKYYTSIRENVKEFLAYAASLYDRPEITLLDIAPQVHEGAAFYFKQAKVETLDIDPSSNATYIADLCENNKSILADNIFDLIVCTEVLEHTRQPFAAVDEMYRLLKPDGLLFVSTPFNFRIHGPLPDCWRFTEHGLRELLKRFSTIELKQLEEKTRWLAPIHYTVIAKK